MLEIDRRGRNKTCTGEQRRSGKKMLPSAIGLYEKNKIFPRGLLNMPLSAGDTVNPKAIFKEVNLTVVPEGIFTGRRQRFAPRRMNTACSRSKMCCLDAKQPVFNPVAPRLLKC
jgi:hypothetical protein